MDKKKTRNFILRNQIGEISLLAGKVDQLGEAWGLTTHQTMNINLALEEALSNIIYYAFEQKGDNKIRVSLSMDDQTFTIRIADGGIPFDPTTREIPDITLPADERPIGGLGIFLISKIMD